MKEIISLQFGHYSNFIGTHWWNLQETGFNYSDSENTIPEINHDVLFREGQTYKGEVTFTPRLLLVDLKGSLQTLPKQGELYEQTSNPLSSIPWSEQDVEVITEEKLPRNTFQDALKTPGIEIDSSFSDNLNSDVKVWSDFLYSRFHPRTVNVVRHYEHESKDVPFDVFNLGRNLWQSSEFSDDFSDKIRSYMEECDSLQGFHITVDSVNAFGGLATSCLEYLKDEYDKKSVLVFAAIPSHYSDYNFNSPDEREESTRNDSIRLLNLAMCIEAFGEYSSLVIPLCTGSKGWRQPGHKRNFQHVLYEQSLLYHTSAILASAMDTFTMPYRLKSSQFSLSDFCADLTGHGRKVAAASVCLPFPLKSKEDLIDCLNNWEGNLWESITPNCDIATDKILQIVTARGMDENRALGSLWNDEPIIHRKARELCLKMMLLLKRPAHQAKKQREMQAYRCETVQEMLEFYLSCTSYATASHVTTLSTPLSVRTPFPNIFDEYVDTNGDILDFPPTTKQGVKTVSMIAACHSGSFIGNMLETLHRETARIKIARFPQFAKAGLEADEYNDSLNRLLDLRECYENSFE